MQPGRHPGVIEKQRKGRASFVGGILLMTNDGQEQKSQLFNDSYAFQLMEKKAVVPAIPRF